MALDSYGCADAVDARELELIICLYVQFFYNAVFQLNSIPYILQRNHRIGLANILGRAVSKVDSLCRSVDRRPIIPKKLNNLCQNEYENGLLEKSQNRNLRINPF